MAFCSSGRQFGGGGLDLARRPTILVLACWARQESVRFRPHSTAATISRTGILFGAGAKFRPLLKTPLSAVDRGQEDRFTTHLSLRGARASSLEWNSKVSNFLFWRVLHLSVVVAFLSSVKPSSFARCSGSR